MLFVAEVECSAPLPPFWEENQFLTATQLSGDSNATIKVKAKHKVNRIILMVLVFLYQLLTCAEFPQLVLSTEQWWLLGQDRIVKRSCGDNSSNDTRTRLAYSICTQGRRVFHTKNILKSMPVTTIGITNHYSLITVTKFVCCTDFDSMVSTTTKKMRTKRPDTRPNEKERRKISKKIEDQKVIQQLRVTKKRKSEHVERVVERAPPIKKILPENEKVKIKILHQFDWMWDYWDVKTNSSFCFSEVRCCIMIQMIHVLL